jgi:hypothetical protein
MVGKWFIRDVGYRFFQGVLYFKYIMDFCGAENHTSAVESVDKTSDSDSSKF